MILQQRDGHGEVWNTVNEIRRAVDRVDAPNTFVALLPQFQMFGVFHFFAEQGAITDGGEFFAQRILCGDVGLGE